MADYGNNIFSSDPEEEKKLTSYFIWLKNNYNTLTPQQRNDWNVLKVRQNLSVLKNKSVDELNDNQIEFLSQYGINTSGSQQEYISSINKSSANINFVQNKTELPKGAEKVGSESGFKKSQDVYKYYNSETGTTQTFYVVKDTKKYSSAPVSTNILSTYKKLSDVIFRTPKKNSSTTEQLTGKKRGTDLVKLWYSADYQKLYTAEIERQTLEILSLPDMVLSYYNWETIDSLPDSNGTLMLEGDEVIYQEYQEPEVKIQSTIPPEVANFIYKIQEQIAPVHDSLNNYISTDATILSNFGYRKSRKSDITPSFPSYTSGGDPRYDIQLEFDDIDGVSGYAVYLVEEDGII